MVHGDLHSWLRSHAALVVPMMAIAHVIHQRRAGISWSEARGFAGAMSSGFRLVRELGNAITPGAVVRLAGLPAVVVTALFWATSRSKTLRDLGLLGPAEARMLIDQMAAAAPGKAEALLAIRP